MECGDVLTKINSHRRNTSYPKEYHSDNNSPLRKYSGNSVLFHVPAYTRSIISCFGECVQILNKFWHNETGINCMYHKLTSKCYKWFHFTGINLVSWFGATVESHDQHGRQRSSHPRQRYFRTDSWREDDVTEMTLSRRHLWWRELVHFLLINMT